MTKLDGNDYLRALVSRETNKPVFKLEDILFGPQLALVSSGAKWKLATCSRRSGKTVGCAAALLDSALRRPGSVSLYLTVDRTNGKAIVWNTLLDLNKQYRLGGRPNTQDLALRFPNKSTVYLAGAGDEREIGKRRGLALGCVVIDESQLFPERLERLVDDVLAPALMDFDGQCYIIGSPPPIPVGPFYRYATSSGFTKFHWTVFDNPWIEKKSGKTPQQHLEAELKRRSITADEPSIQREWFGRFVQDTNSLVLHWTHEKNTFDELPPSPRGYEAVIGVDLGWSDSDAIAVIQWSPDSPVAWLVHEDVAQKQTITDLVRKLEQLIQKYNPLSIVMDTGGIGKKVSEEIMQRHAIPLKAAEKAHKHAAYTLLDDSLRSGHFRTRSDSRFAHDAQLLEWDREKSTNERFVVSSRFHSDILDASLYGFREALAWTYRPTTPAPKPGTEEYWRKVEDELEERTVNRLLQERQEKEELEQFL